VTVDISRELIDDCVHCGFCLPTCPTYGPLWRRDGLAARADPAHVRLVDGTVELGDHRAHFDRCLGCMAC
jgi:glycolate oxidase iron-sulfur subunit